MTEVCLDCHNSSRGLCPVHADNDTADLEIAKLRAELARLTEENASLRQAVVRLRRTLADVEGHYAGGCHCFSMSECLGVIHSRASGALRETEGLVKP